MAWAGSNIDSSSVKIYKDHVNYRFGGKQHQILCANKYNKFHLLFSFDRISVTRSHRVYGDWGLKVW